jgi:hypothetical protein
MVYGYGVRTTTAQGDPVVVLWSDGDWRESTSAVYLLDDGHSVTPHWCSGGSAGGGIWLQPFPLDFNADGSPRMTGDGVRNANGMPSRPVDMSTWMLAPSRCYHVKVSTDVRDLDQHGRELPLPD